MREQKPKQVNTVKHEKGGIEVPVLLNAKTMIFEASYAGNFFQNKDGDALMREVWKEINDSITIDWNPVISVKNITPSMVQPQAYLLVNPFIGFELSRFYIGQVMPSGDYKESYWESNDHLRSANRFHWGGTGDFILPCKIVRHNNAAFSTHYFAYSEERWNGLKLLQERISQLRARLDQLLDSPDGIDQIAEIGASTVSLLQAPVILAVKADEVLEQAADGPVRR